MATITRITTGFLTGNLFSDVTGIDELASAQKYKDVLLAALEAAYPDTEIEVRMQRASGATPFPLKTAVDFDTDESDFRDEERIIEAIDCLAERVFEQHEAWVVYSNEA